MTVLETDRSALEAFRRGDPAVLTCLFREHATAIFKLARDGFTFRAQEHVYRFSGYRLAHEQQDLVQETFARAFAERARLAYDGLTPFTAYLRGIAKNLAIDAFRSASQRALRTAVEIDDENEPLVSCELAPDEQLRRGALMRAVQEFVAGLSDVDRKFVSLRYEDKVGQEEIAKELGCSRRHVRTLEGRLRKAMFRHLRQRGLVEPGSRGGSSLLALALLMLARGGG